MGSSTEVVVMADVARWLVGGDDWVWWGSWSAGGSLFWSVATGRGDVEAGQVDGHRVVAVVQRLAAALPGPDEGSLRRVLRGEMAWPTAEAQLARALGDQLVPPPLRDLLAADTGRRVIVSPAPVLAQVPFDLLDLGNGVRLCERATVVVAPPVAVLDHVRHRPDPGRRARPVTVVDTVAPHLAGARDLGRPWAEAAVRLGSEASGHGDAERRPATVGALEEALADAVGRPGAAGTFAYFGHVIGPGDGPPTEAALPLVDRPLTAREMMTRPEAFPLPDRCILLGCSSAGGRSREWSGLGPALLVCGARLAVATAWDLPDWEQTVRLADEVLSTCAPEVPDPQALLDAARRRRLDEWRALGHAHRPDEGPLIWGSLRTIGTGRRDVR